MLTIEIIIALIGLFFTIGTFLLAFPQLWAAIHPVLLENKNRKILTEKFSRGPYDKATIERATKYYIRPKCSNIDPAQEQELRHALMATREDLFDKVDHFIFKDESFRHLLILADSGTGKTSFVLNYFAYNFRKGKQKQCQIALIPLGRKNADELIDQIPNQDETVLFLDALDEDRQAIANYRERVTNLMQRCSNFKKIVITCRTQFFPRGEEIPTETGILKIGPRKAGEKGMYEFWKLYLSPFDDNDIKKYIYKRYSFWMKGKRKKALAVAHKIPLLAVRPMLLAHIPDIIDRKEEILYSYEIYEIMVNAWLEREIAWVDKNELRRFSENLSIDLYLNPQNREHDGIKYYELAKLAQKWKVDLQDWQLGGRSLLNRDAEDYFKFSHRSILEYLFLNKILTYKLSVYGILLTDQMTLFLSEMYSKVPYLSHLLSKIGSNLVFNITHDADGSIVNSLPEIDWKKITENKINSSDAFLAEPKIAFGERKITISYDDYLKFRRVIRQITREGIAIEIVDKKSMVVEQNHLLAQIRKETEFLELVDIILSIQNINKSGVITIFPNKDLTVLEIIIQGKSPC